MDEQAKAVQEVAKTTGKAIDAARLAGGFIARYVAGPLEQGMGIFEDRLRYHRWERQLRLMQRAEQMLKEVGLSGPSRAVPLKLAVPLLQGATLEDDDELQDRWAALLVNAANANSAAEITRSHIDILNQINRLEARILDAIYSIPWDVALQKGVVTTDLPNTVRVQENESEPLVEPEEEIVLAMENLLRLGCLRSGSFWDGGQNLGMVYPTRLGRSFVNACRLSKA